MLRSTLLLVLTIAAALPATAAAAAQRDASPCQRNLKLASTGVNDIAGRLKSAAKATGEERCAAYRQHFLVAVRARAVLADCKGGPDRNADIGRLDGAIEDINGAIAESCAVQ
jgi:hypothetical protein